MEPEKEIIDIFYELKKRNLIDSNRKLKVSKNSPMAFKASVFTSNTITFNPNSCEGLDDDMIRFCLLHEEGHLKREQHGVPALLFLVGLGLFPFLFFILQSFYIQKVDQNIIIISLFFMLFVLFSSIRILTEPFHWDEYGSDEFASKILQHNYGVTKPSEILKNTLNVIPSSLDLSKLIFRLFFTFIENHPSTEQRVRNIVELVDEK
jgi:Zn-dependent protease with chaperone function